jgi:thymidylate synthase (FAD)
MIKVVNPSVEIWKQECYTLDDIWKHIARCARVCYQSVPKNNGETDYGFIVRTLLKHIDVVNQPYNIEKISTCHLSVFEHGTVHLKYRLFITKDINKAIRFTNNYYSRTKEHYGYAYVTTNMRVLIENNWMDELEFIDATPNCPYYAERTTINFTTDIGTSRELNRHRCHSISEESTRYCRYNADKFGNNITVAKLPWIPDSNTDNISNYNVGFYEDDEIYYDGIIRDKYTVNWNAIDWFLYGLQIANLVYCKCIELGWTAQQAREILPLNTKTQVVHTAFVDDWQRFIELRSDGVSGVPHPMAKELADEVKFLLSCKSCG